MKTGFTLLEVLIGTFIASILSTILMYFLAQTTSLQHVVDMRIDVWTTASILENQLERDIMGTFVPFAGFPQPKEESKTISGQQQIHTSTPIKKEQKKIERIFYIDRNERGVQLFSCITTSMLPHYQHPQTHVGRVVYSLIPHEDDRRILSLIRQEGHLFELEEYTKQNSPFAKVELANNIAALNMRFIVITPKEDGSGFDFEMSDNWPVSKTESTQTTTSTTEQPEEEQEKLIPDFVEITATLWRDIARERTETIIWYAPITAISEPYKKNEHEKEEQESKTNATPSGTQGIKNQSAGKAPVTQQAQQRTTSMNKYGFPVKLVHNN